MINGYPVQRQGGQYADQRAREAPQLRDQRRARPLHPRVTIQENLNNTLHLSIFNMSYMKVLFEKQIRIRIIAKKVMGASVN